MDICNYIRILSKYIPISHRAAYASICKFFEMKAEESSDLDDDSDASVDLDDSNLDSDGEQWTRRVRRKITFED